MISAAYCRMMARYNAWQNGQVKAAAERLTEADLHADRGAFFGSIMGTLNHLLWGDLLWMSRFDGGAAPTESLEASAGFCPTLAAWGAERFRADGRIRQWAAPAKASSDPAIGVLTGGCADSGGPTLVEAWPGQPV